MAWTIGRKIVGGFAGLIAITLTVSLVGYFSMNHMSGAENVKSDRLNDIIVVYQARMNVNETQAIQMEFMFDEDMSVVEEYNSAANKASELINKIKKIVDTPQEIQWIGDADKQFTEANRIFNSNIVATVQKILKAKEAGESTDILKNDLHKYDGNSDDAFVACNGFFENIESSLNEEVTEASDDFVSTRSTASGSIIAIMIAGIALGVLGAFFITRTITKPILRIVQSLKEGADQVSSASNQVTQSSQVLAEGSSEQASSLEETSSSLEEMSTMTNQNSDNATQAKNLMDDAGKVVDKVNDQMEQMVTAITEISRSSEETSKIIKTIEEIAFQTNLLALNAAVEAARAGEAGKGFAVVADEVRNLAGRSAEAAKNTTELIENTINAVKNGNSLVEVTQDGFKENAELAGKVSKLIAEIAAASREQADGVSQINQGVGQIEKVVQQNASSAEESASAAEELSAQAHNLNDMVLNLSKMVEVNEQTGENGNMHRIPVSRKNTVPKKRSFESTGLAIKKNEAEKVIPMDDDFTEF